MNNFSEIKNAIRQILNEEYGYGDQATWGAATNHPHDPRYNGSQDVEKTFDNIECQMPMAPARVFQNVNISLSNDEVIVNSGEELLDPDTVDVSTLPIDFTYDEYGLIVVPVEPYEIQQCLEKSGEIKNIRSELLDY